MTHRFNLCLPKAVIKISISCSHIWVSSRSFIYLFFNPDNFKSLVEKRKGEKSFQWSKGLGQKLPQVPVCLISTLQAKAEEIRSHGPAWEQEFSWEPQDETMAVPRPDKQKMQRRRPVGQGRGRTKCGAERTCPEHERFQPRCLLYMIPRGPGKS